MPRFSRTKPTIPDQPSDDKEYFDDCPICQVTKFADKQGRNPTETELVKAFREAKKSGAIVGGKWFENKNP